MRLLLLPSNDIPAPRNENDTNHRGETNESIAIVSVFEVERWEKLDRNG